jgi:hypothetical protein
VSASALSSGHHSLGVQFITSLKSTVFVALTKKNTKENIILHHAQDTIELLPSVLLTGINWLLVTKM